MRLRFMAVVALVPVAVLFVFCGDSNKADGGSRASFLFDIGTYTLLDSVLTTLTVKTECDVNELSTWSDTGRSIAAFTSSQLTLSSTETLGGAEVTWTQTYKRRGSGSGLVGTWEFQDYTMTVAGTLIGDDLERVQKDTALYNAVLSYGTYVQEFTDGGRTSVFFEGDVAGLWLDLFVADSLEAAKEEYYLRIEAIATSDNTIKYTGGITGEVITVTFDDSMNVTSESSNPNHQPLIVNPRVLTVCPQPDSTWVDNFYSENTSKPYVMIDILDRLGIFDAYDLRDTVVGDTTLIMYGQMSGSSVSATFRGDTAVLWQSSVPAYTDTLMGPIGPESLPPWFLLFLGANQKPPAKRTADTAFSSLLLDTRRLGVLPKGSVSVMH